MEALSPPKSEDKWTPGSPPSVYGAEHETEGVEEDMSSPLHDHSQKVLESSIDSHSDTTTTPSLSISRSSTLASSVSTVISLDSHVGRYNQQEAAFDEILPFVPSRTFSSHRASTWPQVAPQSNHDVRVPPNSSNGSSTTRYLYRMAFGPMVEGYPGLIEGSNAISKSQSKGQSHRKKQSPPGHHASSPDHGTLGQPVYPQSSGRVFDEALLSASAPSTMPSPRFGLPEDPAIFSGATKSRVEFELPEYMAGIDQNHAYPGSGPCEWAGYWEDLHDSWKTELLGPCKFPSSQTIPALFSHIHKHSKHGRAPFRRQKDYQANPEAWRHDNINARLTSTENLRGERDQLSLDSLSVTNPGLDSKISLDSMRHSTSKGNVHCNLGGKPDGVDSVSQSPSSHRSSHDGSPSSLDGECKLGDNNDEVDYESLVDNIKKLVIDSPCVDDLEERGVPLVLYIHRFLEQVYNHTSASPQRHTSSLPIRTLPIRSCNPGANANKSGVPRRPSRKGNGENKKRKNGENSGPGRGGKDADQNSPNDDAGDGSEDDMEQVKRQKTGNKDDDEDMNENLICPFRKRNPLRFNVRDHPQCALNPFRSLALLKCLQFFQDEEKLAEHQRDDERCEKAPESDVHKNPENGITVAIMQELVARAGPKKVNSWKGVWKALFRHDKDIPDSEEYEPPVELDEVQNRFYDQKTWTSFLRDKNLVGQDEASTGQYGYQYIPVVFGLCRDEQGHEESPARLERDKKFLEMVHVEAVPRPHSGQPSAQQAYQSADFGDPVDPERPSYPTANSSDFLKDCESYTTYPNHGAPFTAADQDIGQIIARPNASPHAPPGTLYPYPYLDGQNAGWQEIPRSKVASESSGYGTMRSDQDGGSGEVDQYNVSHVPTPGPQVSEFDLASGGEDSQWPSYQLSGWFHSSQ